MNTFFQVRCTKCIPDAHSNAIVKPPISLVPDLAALLQPDIDIKVKHGVIGLLKHLAQSQGCRAALGEAGIIQRLGTSQIWGDRADMFEIIQVAAIGVAKHMCNADGKHDLDFLSTHGVRMLSMFYS